MSWGKAVFLGLIIAIALTAYAIGASSKSSKTIVLCAAKKSGELRLAAGGKCGKSAKRIVLTKEGRAGTVGPQGVQGIAGNNATASAGTPIAVGAGIPFPGCAAQPGVFCDSGPPNHYCYAFENAGGDLAPVTYRKDSMGFVHLTGSVTNNTSGGAGCTHTATFYLPAGYRVNATEKFAVPSCDVVSDPESNPPAYLEIRADGGLYGVGAGCFSLDGITFFADA